MHFSLYPGHLLMDEGAPSTSIWNHATRPCLQHQRLLRLFISVKMFDVIVHYKNEETNRVHHQWNEAHLDKQTVTETWPLFICTWWRHQMETFSALVVLVWVIHRSPVNSPHKSQWRGTLMFSLICGGINDWVSNREAGDLRRHRAHYDVTVMILIRQLICNFFHSMANALWSDLCTLKVHKQWQWANGIECISNSHLWSTLCLRHKRETVLFVNKIICIKIICV